MADLRAAVEAWKQQFMNETPLVPYIEYVTEREYKRRKTNEQERGNPFLDEDGVLRTRGSSNG